MLSLGVVAVNQRLQCWTSWPGRVTDNSGLPAIHISTGPSTFCDCAPAPFELGHMRHSNLTTCAFRTWPHPGWTATERTGVGSFPQAFTVAAAAMEPYQCRPARCCRFRVQPSDHRRGHGHDRLEGCCGRGCMANRSSLGLILATKSFCSRCSMTRSP